MTSLNISLPEPLKFYVEAKVATGDYGTPSEYVRELIRHDKRGQVRRLEAELLEAVVSGDFELSPGELKGGSLVKALRKKVTRRRS
ncbi:MAG: hypothetical protein WBD10_06935 [Acidobacteriaceae bacterium]